MIGARRSKPTPSFTMTAVTRRKSSTPSGQIALLELRNGLQIARTKCRAAYRGVYSRSKLSENSVRGRGIVIFSDRQIDNR
jgi:hypothetical protein